MCALPISQPFWAGDRPAWRPLADPTIPELYQKLRELPKGGVIELPLQYQPLTVPNARFQYNQIAHLQPLLNCNQLIRRTDLLGFAAYIRKNAFLGSLVDPGRRGPPFAFSSEDLQKTYEDGFRYVIFHTTAAADSVRLAGNEASADLLAEPLPEMLHDVLGAPILEDSEMRVYAIPPQIPPGSYRWDGHDVIEPPFLLDSRRYGFPLVLEAGTKLVLWEGPARQVSFWMRGDSGLFVEVNGEKKPLAAEPEQWRWHFFAGGTLVLEAPSTQKTTVYLSRLQVLL